MFLLLSLTKFCIKKQRCIIIFWLIDSSTSDLELLELKKNESLDPELRAWLLYSE